MRDNPKKGGDILALLCGFLVSAIVLHAISGIGIFVSLGVLTFGIVISTLSLIVMVRLGKIDISEYL